MWEVLLQLRRVSPIEAHGRVNGVEVRVSSESKAIQVLHIPAATTAEAKEKAVEACNAFLDELSAKKHGDLELDLAAGHQTKMADPNGSTRVSVGVQDSVVLTERVVVVRKDASGNVIDVSDSARPGEISVRPTDAKAYYRKARTTDDVFEKFRNFYLVLENISDKVRQQQVQPVLKEKPLLVLGLRTCLAHCTGSLSSMAKSLPGFCATGKLLDDVAELLYKGQRCQLNHAKASQQKKVPFRPKDEDEVRNVIQLAEFVASSMLDYEERCLTLGP